MKKKNRIPKQARPAIWLASVLAAVSVLGTSGLFISSDFLKKPVLPESDLEYGSALIKVEKGERYSAETADKYSPVDIFGRLNYTFSRQTNWYGEMHGTVDTVITQQVETYKQYNDGILISADLTKSSIVSGASQFCYMKELDRVLWRKPAGGADTYDGLDTVWKTGEPYRAMAISGKGGFKATNGLPAYELSVYVIEENTVLSSDVTDNGDGTYTVDYELAANPVDAEKNGVSYKAWANEYYVHQMVFTGGLPDTPEFKTLNVSFTFNGDWEVLHTDVEESYTAQYGFIKAPCTSSSRTTFEYNTPKATSTAYEEYFSKYVDEPVNVGPTDHELTPVDCLAQAFGKLLTEPTALDFNLSLNGNLLDGYVWVDLSDVDFADFSVGDVEARAVLGNAVLWFKNGLGFLKYGDARVRLSAEELLSAVGGTTFSLTDGEGGTDDLLSALGSGEFIKNGSGASLKAVLPLGPLEIPLDFYFRIGADQTVTLDRAEIGISGETLSLSAVVRFGNRVPPALNASDEASYVSILPYVQTVSDIFASDVLHAEASFTKDPVSVSLGVDYRRSDGLVAGDLSATYGTAQKRVKFTLAGETVYLDLDGVKLKAATGEALDLIKDFIPEIGESNGFDVDALLKKVLSGDFADALELTEEQTEEGNMLRVALDGSALLRAAFGISLPVGDLELTVSDRISANVLGAELSLSAGTEISSDTTGYVDVNAYAATVADLFKHDGLLVDVSYAGGGLTVGGSVGLSFSPFAAQGKFLLSYGSFSREVIVGYDGEDILLTIDSLKLKTDAAKAKEILASVLAAGSAPAATPIAAPAALLAVPEINSTLEAFLNLKFGDLVDLTEGEGALHATVRMSALLSAFGLDLDVGELQVTLREGELTASVKGVQLSVKPGTAVTVDSVGFADVTPVLEKVPALLAAQGITFSGDLSVTVGNTTIALEIGEGIVSWAGQTADVYLDATLFAGESAHHLLLRVNGDYVTAVYGDVGATVRTTDFATLKEALDGLVSRLESTYAWLKGETILPAPEKPQPEPLPEPLPEPEPEPSVSAVPASLGTEEILSVYEEVCGGAALTEALAAFDWTSLLSGITFAASGKAGGLAKLGLFGLEAELWNELDENGFVGLSLAGDSFTGTLHTGILNGTFPEMPSEDEVSYLSVETFTDLIDYVGAAAELLGAQSMTLDFTSTVYSSDAAYAAVGGVKYEISAQVRYYAGTTFPLHLDTEGRNLWVNTDLYLGLTFALKAQTETDQSLYLDVTAVDASPEDGSADGNLDFYLSLSSFGPDSEKYDPLKIWAPADELMTILSSGVALLGVDVDLVNDYFVSKWIDVTTVARLRALGSTLLPLLGGLLGGSEQTPTEPAPEPAPTEPAPETTPDPEVPAAVRKGFLKAVERGENTFTVTLDSAAIYGAEGLEDITFTMTKEMGEDGLGHITGLTLNGVYNKDTVEHADATLGLSSEPVFAELPELTGYYLFNGMDRLLLTLAKSATSEADGEIVSGEETQHTYKINRNFYLDGSADVGLSLGSLDLISISIRLIAVSVSIDENGELGINLRLEYDGEYVALAAPFVGDGYIINGDSQVDLTIKNNMVYIKRVQTTDFNGKGFLTSHAEQDIEPVTLYRAMPMESFTADILNQMKFLFNFGDGLWNFIMKQVENSSSESTEPTDPAQPEEAVDYGTKLKNYLSGYTYTAAEDGSQVWKIAINGNALLENLLKDINVTLSADVNQYLRSVNVETSLLGLMNVKANLNWRNPGGVFEEGVSDVTDPALAERVEAEIGQTIAENDWAARPFLEAKQVTLRYTYLGARDGVETAIAENDVFVASGGDGTAENTLYSADVELFDLAAYGTAEYSYAWAEGTAPVLRGETVPADGKLTLTQTINKYTVTFTSEKDFGLGWTDTEGTYSYAIEMEYGSVVEIGGVTYTVEGERTFELPAAPLSSDGRQGEWTGTPTVSDRGATFEALYPAGLTLKSTVGFTLPDAEGTHTEYTCSFTSTAYELPKPSAEGHIFLGWFEETAEGWREVTVLNAAERASVAVEALWMTNVTAEITSATRTSRKGGLFNRMTYYNHTIEATISGGELVGAFAEELGATVTTDVSFKTGSRGFATSSFQELKSGTVNGEEKDSIVTGDATVTVTVTYTINGKTYSAETTATKDWS